jgi:hypothetical protein
MMMNKIIPRLNNSPIRPPIIAENPLMIHPHNCIGGGPNRGKHQENQRNNTKTIRPRRIKKENVIRVFPFEKYIAKIPITIEKKLNTSINILTIK